jgi:hypothetical protein
VVLEIVEDLVSLVGFHNVWDVFDNKDGTARNNHRGVIVARFISVDKRERAFSDPRILKGQAA